MNTFESIVTKNIKETDVKVQASLIMIMGMDTKQINIK